MLYLIGLGLGGVKDVTVKGLEIIRKCDRVYLETDTSIFSTETKNLEQFYGRPILETNGELVENNALEILAKSKTENVALLVVGDPFGATRHTDLILRAQEQNLQVKLVHNASILTAIGCCGLQLYRFGETVSIPYWSDDQQPDSFYNKILRNRQMNLHTLCLLDVKVKEAASESLIGKEKEYMPPRFMTVSEAVAQLNEMLERQTNERTQEEEFALNDSSIAIGLARVGWDDQCIVACSLREMASLDIGPPPHCMVIPAVSLHCIEEEFLASIEQYEVASKRNARHENQNK
ncbi:diphthine methyl ester synthase [Lasioglossum baleicum]|uniref:diphthine methyl ester synthase n=1 Tax=Lasioglossum baleicum TaxID=434251 RepID=UPI003FCEAE83